METPARDKWRSQLTAREKWKIASLGEQHCYCKQMFCCGRVCGSQLLTLCMQKFSVFSRAIQPGRCEIEHDINFAWRRQIGKISAFPFLEWIGGVFLVRLREHFVERIIQSNDAVSMQLFAVRLLRIHNLFTEYCIATSTQMASQANTCGIEDSSFRCQEIRFPISTSIRFDLIFFFICSRSIAARSSFDISLFQHALRYTWAERDCFNMTSSTENIFRFDGDFVH